MRTDSLNKIISTLTDNNVLVEQKGTEGNGPWDLTRNVSFHLTNGEVVTLEPGPMMVTQFGGDEIIYAATEKGMEFYPWLRRLVNENPDPLYLAVKLAFIANIPSFCSYGKGP